MPKTAASETMAGCRKIHMEDSLGVIRLFCWGKAARLEMHKGTPILLETRAGEASEETQQAHIKYGARTTWETEYAERGRRDGVMFDMIARIHKETWGKFHFC